MLLQKYENILKNFHHLVFQLLNTENQTGTIIGAEASPYSDANRSLSSYASGSISLSVYGDVLVHFCEWNYRGNSSLNKSYT